MTGRDGTAPGRRMSNSGTVLGGGLGVTPSPDHSYSAPRAGKSLAGTFGPVALGPPRAPSCRCFGPRVARVSALFAVLLWTSQAPNEAGIPPYQELHQLPHQPRCFLVPNSTRSLDQLGGDVRPAIHLPLPPTQHALPQHRPLVGSTRKPFPISRFAEYRGSPQPAATRIWDRTII